MEILVLVSLILAVVAAFAFVVFSKGQRGLVSLSLKVVASFMFTLLAVSICYTQGMGLAGLFFVMGFVASCFGDTILGLPDMPEMQHKATPLVLIGGLCFTVAHLGYIAGMILLFGFAWWVILVAVALGLVFFFANKFIGKLDYGKLTGGMPIYAVFVSFVVAESIMAFVSGASIIGSIMLLAGFFLFWLSDIVLMNIYFGKFEDKPNKKVFLYYFNLAFYYGAQILIAASLMFFLPVAVA